MVFQSSSYLSQNIQEIFKKLSIFLLKYEKNFDILIIFNKLYLLL